MRNLANENEKGCLGFLESEETKMMENAAEILRRAAELAEKADKLSQQGAADKAVEELRRSAGRLADQAVGMLTPKASVPVRQHRSSALRRLTGAALCAVAALSMMPELRQDVFSKMKWLREEWRR